MSASQLHALGIVLVAAAMTFVTRSAPFVLFGKKRGTPPIVLFLGTYLPPAILAMLVVYGLKDVRLLAYPYGLPELIGVATVVGLHVWKRNYLLSIFVGTAAYMVAVQWVFQGTL